MQITKYLNEAKVVSQDIIANQEDVLQINYITLKRLTIVFTTVCMFILLISFLISSYAHMRVSYAITLSLVGFIALFVRKVKSDFKYTLFLLYFIFILFGLFCIYLSGFPTFASNYYIRNVMFYAIVNC